MKCTKLYLDRAVIESIAKTQPCYERIENYFIVDDYIAVSPLMMHTLLNYFKDTNKKDFTAIHTTFWDGLYYANESDHLEKFIVIDNSQGKLDFEYYNNFSIKYRNSAVIDRSFFWLLNTSRRDNAPPHLHTIFSDLFLAWILIGNNTAARKEFTKKYLSAINNLCQPPSHNNIGKLRDFDNSMKSLTPTQKLNFHNILLSDFTISAYTLNGGSDDLFEEFKACFNHPQLGMLDPLLRKITPLNLGVTQMLGSAGLGLLSGQNKIALGILFINGIYCFSAFTIANKSDNFTKDIKIPNRADCNKNDMLESLFKVQGILSTLALCTTCLPRHDAASIFNISMIVISACKILQSRDAEPLTFGD